MYEAYLIFGLCLWVLISLMYLRTKWASAFHPVTYYLAFHGIVFVVRPFFQYNYSYHSVYDLYGFYPDEETKGITLLIANLGLISFCLGAYLTGRLSVRFWDDRRLRLQDRALIPLLSALLLAAPIIIYSTRYAISINFGSEDLRRLVRDTTTFHTIYTETSAYVVDANLMLGAFGVAIAWSSRFRPLAFIPFLSFLALRLTVGWSRYTFILTTLSLALLFLFESRRKWLAPWMLLGGLLLLGTFNALSAQRSLIADWIKGVDTQMPEFASQREGFFDKLDFANLEFVEYLVSVIPEQTGTFNYFTDVLEIFTAPVPRVFWSEKPVGPPIQLYNINDYGFPVGITLTLVGEGWQGLGYAGVLFWCGFGGVLWGGVYRWFVRHRNSTFSVLYYCLLLPLCIQWYRDGLLLNLVKFPLFFLLPVAIAQSVAGLRSRQAHPMIVVSSGRVDGGKQS